MFESGELRKGKKLEIDGEPYVVVQFAFVKPGKGGVIQVQIEKYGDRRSI